MPWTTCSLFIYLHSHWFTNIIYIIFSCLNFKKLRSPVWSAQWALKCNEVLNAFVHASSFRTSISNFVFLFLSFILNITEQIKFNTHVKAILPNSISTVLFGTYLPALITNVLLFFNFWIVDYGKKTWLRFFQ